MNAPLEGIRVLELGGFLAAPYATAVLAGLGATVLKIEPPITGDPYRRGLGVDDPYFAQYNTGKKSAAINLKSDVGRQLVRDLADRSDVLVHNMRPGKVEKLGLGHDVLRQANPRLIYAAISGFGGVGPLGVRPGYDSIGESITGLYARLGGAQAFQAGGLPLADTTTGVMCALGVTASLARRAETAEGVLVETSLFEVASMLSTLGASERAGRHVGVPGDDGGELLDSERDQAYCVTCLGDEPMLIALGVSESTWLTVLSLLDDRIADPLRSLSHAQRAGRHESIRTALQSAFGAWRRQELLAVLGRMGVPSAPVRTYLGDGARSSPENVGEVEILDVGFTLDGQPLKRSGQLPRVGEHTNEVLRELGIPHRQVLEWLEREYVYSSEPDKFFVPTDSSART